MDFDEDVLVEIEKIPEFFREMARNGLAQYARDKGCDRVTMDLFNEARAKFFADR